MTDEDERIDEFVSHLRDIKQETGYRLPRIFRDWTALAVHAFCKQDEAYNDRLDRYGTLEDDRETRRTVAESFSKALGELILATKAADRPVIGDIYEELGVQDDDQGQFFTDWEVCRMKSQMLFSDDDLRESGPEDPIKISDPACGSARLLIAAARRVHELDEDSRIWVRGTDLDPICARMAVLNLVIFGVPGRIRCGDSLTLEMKSAWSIDAARRPPVEEVEPRTHSSEDEDAESSEQVTLTASIPRGDSRGE